MTFSGKNIFISFLTMFSYDFFSLCNVRDLSFNNFEGVIANHSDLPKIDFMYVTKREHSFGKKKKKLVLLCMMFHYQ